MSTTTTHVTSRDNVFVKELRKLSQDSSAHRKYGRIWIEGEHLCQTALLRGFRQFAHNNVPDEHADDIYNGWTEHYWEPLKEYFMVE